jgi:hypothetical protein
MCENKYPNAVIRLCVSQIYVENCKNLIYESFSPPSTEAGLGWTTLGCGTFGCSWKAVECVSSALPQIHTKDCQDVLASHHSADCT